MLLGIDLGGTKIEGVLLDNTGKEVFRKRILTPANHYDHILRAVEKLVLEMDQAAGKKLPVGIGTPGAVSQASGLLKNSNTVCMNGKPFYDDLKAQLKRPLKIENDANCFALSEAVDGAARDGKVVFGVIIGTGTGGGVVVNKQVLKGANAIAGEWGHNPLPWPEEDELPGLDCYCGKKGCIETWLSGPGMAKNYNKGSMLDSKKIVALAQEKNRQAVLYLQRYCRRLAKSLAHVVNILDPDIVVLGGGMSNISQLYQQVPEYWEDYIFSDQIQTKLKKAQYGDSSGVRGAAWLWKD